MAHKPELSAISTIISKLLKKSEIEISILSLAEKIIAITGSKSSIIHLPALEKGDMARRKPDNAKMKRILGRELISLDEGLRRIISQYQTL
jgi:UDP-glucose 4-epimerase